MSMCFAISFTDYIDSKSTQKPTIGTSWERKEFSNQRYGLTLSMLEEKIQPS